MYGQSQFQPNYSYTGQQPQQQPQPQQSFNGVQQQSYQQGGQPPLKDVEGMVIAVQPHMDQTGNQKISKNGKPIFKIQIQTPRGQPSFWFFQGKQQPPEYGTSIHGRYSESPNPRGNGSPMKTIVFYEQVQGQQQVVQPQQAPQQPIQAQEAYQGGQQVQTQAENQMSSHVNLCKSQGMTQEQALGLYIMKYLPNAKTLLEFRKYW